MSRDVAMDFNEETGIDLPGLRPRLVARSVRELVVGSRAGPVTQEADPCLCQGAFGGGRSFTRDLEEMNSGQERIEHGYSGVSLLVVQVLRVEYRCL